MRLLIMLVLFLCLGQFDASAQLFGGQLKRGKGTVTALSCGSVVNSGNLYAASTANSFTSFVPYSGGNGGVFSGQVITSTGVTGLTATANQQSLAMGSGYVIYTITGIPSAAGTASFAINIGGQTCTITATVQATSAQYPVGSVFCASGASAVVEVSNPVTGKTWMDRNLGASQVATSSTDVNAYGDLYQWGRRSDGHQCRTSATTATLSSVDQPANGNFIISPNVPADWRSPQNSNLWQGLNGVNNPCPNGYRIPTITELNAEMLNWISQNSSGAFSSVLKLSNGGIRNNGSGNITLLGTNGYFWSSTIDLTSSQVLNFGTSGSSLAINNRARGLSLRCIKETTATIGSLNCGSMTLAGNIFSGQAAIGVTITVPYTSGNGGYYAAQSISSAGVTGLTATLASGFLANGSGTIVYTVTGTPSAAGTANFAINLAGQICSFTVNIQSLASQYPVGSVFCASGATAIVDVTNPTTGKTWMDRNLGATQVATSSTDANAYGDLYQWGRRSDGHQCRTSATTTTLSSVDQPGNGNFILSPTTPNDWRSPQNDNLWQGVNGVNNPCPSGYRLPTNTELDLERANWISPNNAGAFSSPLKLVTSGIRNYNNGNIGSSGSSGNYWTSTINGSESVNLQTNIATMGIALRSYGLSVRCIKETVATVGSINCGNATQIGIVYSSQITSGVTVNLPYDGGNGGFQTTQIYSSTGVTGLTATLSAGLVAIGSGSFTLSISGTAMSPGTANFAVSIGGQNCTFSVQVNYNPLAALYPAGSVFCASGPTTIVDVTNPTTGRTWMDRNLGAAQVATSSTDSLSYGDLYQWGRSSDGHQCRYSSTISIQSSTDQPGHPFSIAPSASDWRNPQNDNLWQGINGINNPCPTGYRIPTESEFVEEKSTWTSQNLAGAFSSILKMPVTGYRFIGGSGIIAPAGGYYYCSTINGTYAKQLVFYTSASISSYHRSNNMAVRCIKEISANVGSIDCGGAIITGTITNGVSASGVSATVSYTGGNGGYYNAQTISSTGVTGLTASLSSGNLVNGNGTLVYTISGTPSAAGTATFPITIGGKSCSFSVAVAENLVLLYPANSVFCASGPTGIVDVTNPITGKTWMDRNLGASQAATSSTDAAAYGDLYQWGRGNDGHQCRNSASTTTLSTTDQPGHGIFIYACNCDWRNPQNVNLWQGVNGINNPCPSGYRPPTQAEWDAESANWAGSTGAFGVSVLKLPKAGYRYTANNIDLSVGAYWSTTVENPGVSWNLLFSPSNDGANVFFRGLGLSVRCIKN